MNLRLTKADISLMNCDKIRDLRTVHFEELERIGYFVGLPNDLQKDIYDTYININSLKKQALSTTWIIDIRSNIASIHKGIAELIKHLDQYRKHL